MIGICQQAFRLGLLVVLAAGISATSPALHADELGRYVLNLNDWRTKNPDQVKLTMQPGKNASDSYLQIDISKGPEQEWVVLDGPVVRLDKRERFYTDRLCRFSWELKGKGLDGYAVQIRARQRDAAATSGGSYTRNVQPNRIWETTAELNNAEKYTTWTMLSGRSQMHQSTEQLAIELWIAVPKHIPAATLMVREMMVTEMATVTHVFSSIPESRGNIFFADKGAMKVDFVHADKIKAMSLEFVDEENRVRAKVDGQAGTDHLVLDLPGKGFYTVRAAAEYMDGKRIINTTTTALVGQTIAREIQKKSRFGVMRVWGNGDLWQQTGANWEWGIGGIQLDEYKLNADGTVEPGLKSRAVTYPDQHQTIMTVGSFPKWILPKDQKSGTLLSGPTDWALLEKLFEAFAKANPDLPWFCPMNEPDGFWRGTAEDFVRMHQAIYAGIKKGNPRMKLFGPCMYSIRMNDFEKYASYGLLESLDGIVMHAYVNGTEPEGDFIARVQDMQRFLKKSGKEHLPVYITEYGWCSGFGDWQKVITELTRSQYAARSLALMAAQPLDGIEYFCFKHISKKDAPQYSLIYADDTPTPTFVSFVQALRWLSWTQKGDGQWLQFSPRLHMTVFSNQHQSMGVAWTTEGQSAIRLPSQPRRIEDHMGRPVMMAGHDIPVSQSPVYFEASFAGELKNIRMLPSLSVVGGAEIPLKWSGLFSAPEIKISDRKAVVAADAQPGEYLIIGRSDGVMQGQPFTVLQPLKLDSVEYRSSDDGKKMDVAARVTSALPAGATAVAELVLADGRKSKANVIFEANQRVMVNLPIESFEIGRRYKGQLTVTLNGRIPGVVKTDIDTTLLATPWVEQDASAWSRLSAAMDISSWGPQPANIKSSDCSAAIQTGVGDKGFYLQVTVEDEQHLQTQPAADIWKEDSIQLAFDVDSDKDWQPNNIGFGFNGHRIFEYGVALPSAGGSPVVWRWRADAPDFSAQCVEPRMAADVQRIGTKTIYKILLPWEILGLSQAPAIGSHIGFAIVVNDADAKKNRQFLRLFEGIAESKNPEKYGKLLLVQKQPAVSK